MIITEYVSTSGEIKCLNFINGLRLMQPTMNNDQQLA